MIDKVLTNKSVLNGLCYSLQGFPIFKQSPARIANIMKKPAHLTPTVKFVGKGKLQSAFTADISALPKSFPKGFGSPFYVAKKPRPLGCA